MKIFRKSKVAAIAIVASLLFAATPMFLVQGQSQTTSAERMVELAERAGQQVQNLVDMINANETALTKIETTGLTTQFEDNVTLYETEGLNNLTVAQEALNNSDYDAAVDSAIEALSVFREVYSSIHVILEAAGIQIGHLTENQGLLEAITRELQRIDRLRDILPANAPQASVDLLDDAEELLNEARTLLLDADVTAARSSFTEAEQSISQVYQYLKAQAEESNQRRIYNYCEGVQQRIQARFRYGRNQGVDFTGVLQSFGYQSENQFMEALQNMTQTVQGEQNFDKAIQDCEGISQTVQAMEQALNQEINRHQGQNGSGGNGKGYRGNGGGP